MTAAPDMNDRRTRLKVKMAETRQELIDVLNGLTEEQFDLPTNNEGWTVYDLAKHLAGAEGGMEAIAHRILQGHTGVNEGFDLERYNAGNIRRRADKKIPELIEELGQSRIRMLQLLDSVTDEQLNLPGHHPYAGYLDLYGLFVVVYKHERMHIKEIQEAIVEKLK
jgi:uncharacterized protein (TIGR03083 family)